MQLPLFDAGDRVQLPQTIGRAEVIESQSLNLLTPGKARTGDFHYTLNPYRGCSFDCSYCYAPAFVPDQERRGAWGLWVEAKVRAVEALAKKDLRGKNIFMSSVTDPYQPLEQKIELTRGIVQELLRQQARLVVQTRSPIVLRDIDLFVRFDSIRVNVSITTDDESVRKRFEPSCASIERRLETVRQLKAAGLKTAICVSPMLPMRDPEGFARTIASIGPDRVTTAYFNLSDKAFASDTRQLGLDIAEEYGWNRDAYERSLMLMGKHLPMVTCRGEGFLPEGQRPESSRLVSTGSQNGFLTPGPLSSKES
jgi:DNA repair photolyase